MSACSPPPPAEPPPAPILGLDEIDGRYAQCAGPEKLEDCAPGRFETTFHDILPSLLAQKEALVERWLSRAESADASVVWGLA